jgi:penicillin-binding protein 1B
VGDRQPNYQGFNRALDARRHIGSLMKPVIYLTALRQHERYTLASLLSDSRLRVQGEDKKIWEPQNYDKQYHGDVILYEALVKSYNIPAARLGLELGLSEIARTFRALGGRARLPAYPSVTLGAIELSPFEVAGIYQSLAARGFHSPLRSVRAVLDKDGNALTRYQVDASRDVDPSAVALLDFVLHRVTREGTARQLSSDLDFDVAGKTGTSDNLYDSWFAGFSAQHLAVVWVGHDEHLPTGLTGSSGAMRIWSRLFSTIQTRPYRNEFPSDISMHWIDRTTGQLTGQGCENAVELPFIDGTEPASSTGCRHSSPLDWLKNIFE